MRTLTTSLLLLLFILVSTPAQGQCPLGKCIKNSTSIEFDFSELEAILNGSPDQEYIPLGRLLGFDDPALGFDLAVTQAAPVRFAFAIAKRTDGDFETLSSWASDPVLLVPGTPSLVLQGTGPINTFGAAFDDPALGFDDPALGFDDPALGFDDSALGFDNPLAGFYGFYIECDFETPEIARQELEAILGQLDSDIDEGDVPTTDYALVLAAWPTGLGSGNKLVLGDAAVLPFNLDPSAISSMNRADEDGFAVQELTAVVLEGHYPEPFNPATTIRYTLPEAGPVRLVVYDLLGREVALLAEGVQEAGAHEARFDAAGLPSGIYLYRIEAGGFSQTRPMTLMK